MQIGTVGVSNPGRVKNRGQGMQKVQFSIGAGRGIACVCTGHQNQALPPFRHMYTQLYPKPLK